MLEPDRFVDDCKTALHSADPAATLAALLTDALRNPQALADAFAQGADKPGVVPLFRSDALAVAHVISAPPATSACMCTAAT